MAKVKLNPVFEAFSKQIGDLVFFERGGKTHVRRKGTTNNPRTPEQIEVRNCFTELVGDWSSLNGMMHKGWHQWGSKKKMKGNNAFLSNNFVKQRAGEPIELFKAVGNIRLNSFTVVPGGAGEIICNFNIEGGNPGKHIHFFTKEKNGNTKGAGLTMHNSGADPVSPYTISGIKPGKEYYVYASVTDTAYEESTEVSASIGVIGLSGN